MLELGINTAFVGAIIVIIQAIKKILDKKGYSFSPDMWKIVILFAGIPMALLMQAIKGFQEFNFFEYLLNCFLYSAAATLIYQTGKLSIMAFLEKDRK